MVIRKLSVIYISKYFNNQFVCYHFVLSLQEIEFNTNLVDDLQGTTILNDISKQLAERIIAEMIKEIRLKVESPSISHYVSFILAYLRKSFDVVPIAIVNILMNKIESPELMTNVISKLMVIIQNNLKFPNQIESILILLDIIQQNLQICIHSQFIPQGNFIETLSLMLCDKRETLATTASEILSLFTLFEYQQKLDSGKQTSYQVCSQIGIILCNLFQQDIKLLKYFLNSQQLQLLQWHIYELSGTPLLQIVTGQLHNSKYTSAISAAIKYVYDQNIPVATQILFLCYQCFIQQPNILTANTLSLLAERLCQNNKPFETIITGDGVGQLCQKDLFSFQNIVNSFINIVPIMINMKIDFNLLNSCLSRIFRIICSNQLETDVVLKLFQLVNDFPDFARSFQIFSQYPDGNNKAAIMLQISQIFNYYKQNNEKIYQLLKYHLSTMTPSLALKYFQVGVLGLNGNSLNNVYMVKFIAKYCVSLSIFDFQNHIVNKLSECSQYQIDPQIQLTIRNQLFEVLQCASRNINFDDYELERLPQLQLLFNNLIDGMLCQQLSDDSAIFVRFLVQYITVFGKLRSSVNSSESLQRTQVLKSNFKIFLQQYICPRLLPALLNLILDDSHPQYDFVQSRMSQNILDIIRNLFVILTSSIPVVESNFLFPFQNNYIGADILKNSCKNIIKRIATFVAQSKVQKVQTLSILLAIMDVGDPQIIGENTSQIVSTLLTQLLNNQAYSDILKQSYKVLGKFSKLNKDESIRLFQSIENHNISYKILFLQNFDFQNADEIKPFLDELIINIFHINSKVRAACNEILLKFIQQLIQTDAFEGFSQQFISSLITDGFQTPFFSQRCQFVSLLLFQLGLYYNTLINDSFIQAVVEGRMIMPIVPLIYEQFTLFCVEGIEFVQLEKIHCQKIIVNYLEIAFCNLTATSLNDILTKPVFQNVYNIIGRDPKTHYRVPIKRLLVAAGLCVGRNFMESVLQQCDERLVQFVQQELIENKLEYGLLKPTTIKFTESGRKVASRVNKILKLLKMDSSYGRYEAGQYIIMGQHVPSYLTSQLRNITEKDEEDCNEQDLNLGGLVYNQDPKEADDDELDKLLDEAEGNYYKAATEKDDQDDFVQQVEKQQQQDEKKKIVEQIEEQLDKIRQRRLYKIDARLQNMGKEFENKRAGGDLISKGSRLPAANIPLLSSKQIKKMSQVNKKQLKTGLDSLFQKKTVKGVQVNLKKLGRHASREFKGGRSKVRALKKHQQTATNIQVKKLKRDKK